MTKEYFRAVCKLNSIPLAQGSKIINGRFKPYLSAIDDQYYGDNDSWDAKTVALQAAIKNMGIEKVKEKLSKLK